MAHPYVLAVHIIFVVSWFAGLFYIVRLFIYHVEAYDRPEDERSILIPQYILMQRRLWNIITVPAMILTVGTGVTMLILNPGYLRMPWMHVKLGFVLLLLIYHFSCGTILRKLRRGEVPASSTRLRMWNEGATLLLVAIVFTVVLKSTEKWIWGVAGLIVLGILFMSIIKAVKSRWK